MSYVEKKNIFVLTLTAFCLLLLFEHYSKENLFEIRETKISKALTNRYMKSKMNAEYGDNRITAPHFAVIMQTEECLPAHLLTHEYFANISACDCHVYVVSYRKKCKDAVYFSHVYYNFSKGVTFSKGSNLGYFEAKRKDHSYLYYVFMDDDIELTYNKYTRKTDAENKVPPFQIFTNFLKEYLPARCGPDYEHWNGVRAMLDEWHYKCNRFETPRVLSAGHIDPCFHAVWTVHRDSAEYTLPFADKYDSKSFWLSGIQMSLAFMIAFHSQSVYFPEIKVWNDKHRYSTIGYMKQMGDIKIRREMVDSIRKLAPVKYKNHQAFKDAIKYPLFKAAHTLCVDPAPPRTPIIPYRNISRLRY